MKFHSPLAMLRRNHLPIVSILGCISCLYIISQKDTLNVKFTGETSETGSLMDLLKGRDFGTGDKPLEVPLVLGKKIQGRETEHVNNDKTQPQLTHQPGGDGAAGAPPPHGQPAQTAHAEAAVGVAVLDGEANLPAAAVEPPKQDGPVVSYNDPERVKFPGYEQCAKVDFQPEHAMPLVALATYMSSGDVIIRQRLQSAVGIYTGTWNEAEAGYPRSKSGVFLGSTIDYKLGRTVIAKTQIAQPDHIVTFEGGAVLVIRNPHTMIIAEYLRRKQEEDRSKQFTAEEKAAWFQLPEWKTFFETELGNWRSFAIQWVTYAKRLLTVSYEQFFENPVQETTRIVTFLNVRQDDARISCSIQAYPRDHINKVIDFDPYTDEMKEKIATFAKEVNQTIITRGVRPLPTWKNTF